MRMTDTGIVSTFEQSINGVTYYFVEHQGYFERGGLYGYDDDGERFAFFTKAVLEMLNQINYFQNKLIIFFKNCFP